MHNIISLDVKIRWHGLYDFLCLCGKMKQQNSSEGSNLFFHNGEFYDNAFFLFK
jgi:hypothetical protein